MRKPAQKKKPHIPLRPLALQVAAYCRVSTQAEEQSSSLESQIQYYTNKINGNPNWVCAGIYADTGSGMRTQERPAYLQLMKLCQQRKVDLILTKSISRFGRNTFDGIKAARKLQTLGIDLWFETEGLRSLDIESRTVMEILFAAAQMESESKSKDIKWGLQRSYRDVDSKTSHFVCYGYKHDWNGYLSICENEAEVVRLIFCLRIKGYSLRKISAELESRQILTPTGKSKWSAATLDKLLANEKYSGDVVLQKTFVTNLFSGKQVKNIGQRGQVLIENHHEAIVDRETWKAAQRRHVMR